MKALIPVFCRPLGYIILFISVFLPFLLALRGMVTDHNLLFFKECTKLLMIVGALMILLAFTKDENHETEQIRIKSMRTAVFLTVIFIFGGMIYRTAVGDIANPETSSFLIFLLINVICLEYGVKKALINKVFKR